MNELFDNYENMRYRSEIEAEIKETKEMVEINEDYLKGYLEALAWVLG